MMKCIFFLKEFLKRNTFGDYIESTQLDATIQYDEAW